VTYELFVVLISCLHSYLLKTATDGVEEQIELDVFNFNGAGGVALSMYNTDEVCLASLDALYVQNWSLNLTYFILLHWK
jgi:hypothetical protein